jgi:DNA-binding CsgD family transcriptional regulator
MISISDFSGLLHLLYSAPLEPDKWNTFLDRLCELTRSTSGVMICADSRLGSSVRSQGGKKAWSREELEMYSTRFGTKDPYRLPMLRKRVLGLQNCEDLVPTPTLMNNEMYQQLIAPAGLRYPSLMLLSCELQRLETISFWRTLDEGPMEEAVNDVLRLLVTHIQSALRIRRALGVVEDQLAGANSMLDASVVPTFLLRADAALLHANNAAKNLLEQADGLRLYNGKLAATDGKLNDSFRQFLQTAAAKGKPGWAVSEHVFSLPRQSKSTNLHVLASPVPQSNGESTYNLVLVAGDPDRDSSYSPAALHHLFGLTLAESEVANGLLTGYTLEEIAAIRSTTIGTIRNQTKTILAKTQTRKQSDLILLLKSLPKIAAESPRPH